MNEKLYSTLEEPGADHPRSQRGAAMVELAIVAVPLIVLVLGLFEIGLAWRNSLAMDQASRAAARVGANFANDPASDREALRALVSGLSSAELDQIDYVVLYEVNSAGDMPASCDASSTAACNRYTKTMLAELDDDTRWECAPGAYDAAWCPTSRSPEFHTPVNLGVRIVGSRPEVTGFFGNDMDFTSTTIMRLDPLTR